MNLRFARYAFSLIALVFCMQMIAADQSGDKPIDKFLQSDVPPELAVATGGKFVFNIWLDPKVAKPDEEVIVYLQDSSNFKFKEKRFSLKGTSRASVEATRVGKELLVEIAANLDKADWAPFRRTLNFGFRAEMKADPIEEIRSGDIKACSFKLLDEQGKSRSAKGSTLLTLIGSNAKMRKSGDTKWENPLNLWLAAGANATPLVEVTPEYLTAGEGRVHAELLITGEYVLVSGEDLKFSAPPPQWLILLMSILGGLIHSVYELVSGLLRQDRGSIPTAASKAVIGILSGVIAVLFADKVGITVDKSSLTGFVALGFLVAYVGVDAILKKVKADNDSPLTRTT